MQQNQPANFKNRIGFVLASVGSAVGMGNIWMFPYRVGQYGGAAFLLIYFGFVALFGWVGLSGEFAFGRLTGTGPIGSYAYALRSRGKKGGGVLGAIPLLGSLGIAIGYAVIVGWVVRYCWGSRLRFTVCRGIRRIFRADHRAVRQPAVARRGGARHGAGPSARRAAGN